MRIINKVAVLGGGAFGVALAKLSAVKSNNVILWVRDNNICQYINNKGHHPKYLSQINLSLNVSACNKLPIVLAGADIVILAVPMAALSSVLVQAKEYFSDDIIIICTTKGVEENTLLLPYQVIKQHLSSKLSDRACFLSGPSFAIELSMNMPTAITIASSDHATATFVQEWFANENCRLYRSKDVVGVCVGGAFKNVIAIAAGICCGLGLGRNALAALITRGLSELTRLALCLGGQAATLSGLSGIGDLILSCTDDMSRNHRLGTLLADGIPLKQALAQIDSVVEGLQTAKSIPDLIAKYQIELPICLAVYKVLYENLSTKTAISSLLSRSLKEES